MSKIRLTKSFNFETAHALYGYDGKCKNIHGHSYKLFVTIKGEPIQEKTNPKFGMVMDFGDLKQVVKQEIEDLYDHAILLNKNTPHRELGIGLQEKGHKVIFTEYQPSCENMLLDFVHKIKAKLPGNVELVALKLQETETSYGEWLATDN